jgi:MoaA/NifB/PqqE/SkfB family radical SAM enzyme
MGSEISIAERVDEHTHVPKERLVPKPPFPDAIKIELTSYCNLKCSYCASQFKLRPQGEIDELFLKEILKQGKTVGVKEIGMFLLGESFLVKKLPEYIRYAKEEAGIEYVFLTTNGTLCTQDRLAPVIDAGLDSLKFSVNAGSPERYAEMHGVDCFDMVVANIKNMREYMDKHNLKNPRTCISSIFDEEYENELESFRAMIMPYIDEFYYLPLYNQAGHVSNQKRSMFVGNPGRYENMVSPVPCWGLFNGAKISWDGWLTACYFDHDTRFKIADLNSVSLMDAWHHEKFVSLRHQHLENDGLPRSLCGKCLGLTA